MFEGGTYDEAKKKKMEEAYEFFEKFLEKRTWAAGDEMTIADITLAASVSAAVDVSLGIKLLMCFTLMCNTTI